jgi:aminotransferase
MTLECDRVGGINLGQGICDMPTPPSILEAAAEAIQADKSTYSRFDGIDELRSRIAEKAARFNGLTQVDRERGIVATIGSTGAFNCVVQALFNPGDGFILFEPYYGYHLNTLRVGGLEPSFVSLDPTTGWEVTREALEEAWHPGVRGIMVNTPANPSGKVFSRAELEIIADFCKEHDVLAVTDEIYEYIVYSGAEHINLATLPGMWERTVTMSGFSKTFSITGWRLGYVVGHPDLIEPIGLVNDLFYVCAPTPLQWGLARGMMALDDSYYSEMAADYEKKRDFFCEALTDAGLTPHVPDGAYYVLADITRLGFDDDKDAAMHILETVGVASVPGSSFFVSDVGKTLTRFCYAKDWKVLEAAAAQLRKL